MKIIDTHAHLDQLEDLEGSLQRAIDAGVAAIVVPSMDLKSCRRNLELAAQIKSPKIYIGLGMHPSEVNLNELEEVLALIRLHHDKISAVGEIGLDFWYKGVAKDENKKNEQRTAFRAFLEIAKEFDLPAIIHSRGAWKDCLSIAQDVGVKRAEFHWYSGPIDILDEILSAGYYVSTSPSVAYSPQSRAAMAHAPIERALIETDCPVYYRNKDTDEGFQAEPKDILRTLKAYADLKGIGPDAALRQLNGNAVRFFDLNPLLVEG